MYSLTHGRVSFDTMYRLIDTFVSQEPSHSYKITVGTDSQNFDITKTVVVVAIHRVGKGGIFFYDIKRVKKITNIRQKILYETSLSLDIAFQLSRQFQDADLPYDIEIHVDAGPNGRSSEVIAEVSGWVRACGFDCKFKPDSYAASSIANKISK